MDEQEPMAPPAPQDQCSLYDLNPHPTIIDEEQRQLLTEKAKNFHTQWQKFKTEQFFSRDYYYLISSKYLARWKVYVGYEQIVNDQSPNKFFGSGGMPVINEDICDNTRFDIKFSVANDHYNVVVKSGLQEEKDYIFLNAECWQVITRDIDDDEINEICRYVVDTPQGKKVQIYYQKIIIVPISNQILKDVEYERISVLFTYTFQVSHYASVLDMEELAKDQVRALLPHDYSYKLERDPPAKFWLSKENTHKTVLFNTFMQGCKANSTFSYKLFFQGVLMQSDKKLTDFDILNDSLLVMEMKEWKHDWCFFNKQNLMTAACANCRNVEKLQYLCSCKFVAYCSKNCQLKDRTFHEGRCPTNAESEEEDFQLKSSHNSRKGVVGLRNLGNTCFMNSGLQCISHILELTEYFLKNQYVKDINKANPLGTQGELCTAYAKMLKSLWYGTDSSFSPSQLKRAIGKFQPMFSGYNQHDSGQLITYLLDGLHEDLNRVKVKPYVQSKQYDGREDRIVARQQWNNFLMRNQSQIVDLMYGQYRSMLDCPKCSHRSIQFDPFLMCSLPIINNSAKRLEINFVENNLMVQKIQISFQKSWNWTMENVQDQLAKKFNKKGKKMIFYVATYATCELIDLTRSANEVRSEYKYRSIFVRELRQGENPKTDVKIVLGHTVPHSYYKDQSYRKSLTQYRVHFAHPDTTLRQLHHKIFVEYKILSDVQDYENQIINAALDDQKVRFLAIPTTRYSACEYCGKKGCDGCQIPYDDTPLKKFIENVEEDKLQFELYWRKNDEDISQKVEKFQSGKSNDDGTNTKKGQTTLQDCFKLFQEPEILAEDNAWFCPKCGDFVLARKQMLIYKAPKILALCLKRFKRKQYFQEKYNILVDFPIENLDMSEFVIDKNLPCGHTEDGLENFQEIKENQIQKKPLLYDLFAISNHFGSTGGGHYTAYCKNPINGVWYDFDDSYVQQLSSKNSVITESAYILFYRRKK